MEDSKILLAMEGDIWNVYLVSFMQDLIVKAEEKFDEKLDEKLGLLEQKIVNGLNKHSEDARVELAEKLGVLEQKIVDEKEDVRDELGEKLGFSEDARVELAEKLGVLEKKIVNEEDAGVELTEKLGFLEQKIRVELDNKLVDHVPKVVNEGLLTRLDRVYKRIAESEVEFEKKVLGVIEAKASALQLQIDSINSSNADAKTFDFYCKMKKEIYDEQKRVDDRAYDLFKSSVFWLLGGFVGSSMVLGLAQSVFNCLKFGLMLEMYLVNYGVCFVLAFGFLLFLFLEIKHRFRVLKGNDESVDIKFAELKNQANVEMKTKIDLFLKFQPKIDHKRFAWLCWKIGIVMVICVAAGIGCGIQLLYGSHHFLCPHAQSPSFGL